MEAVVDRGPLFCLCTTCYVQIVQNVLEGFILVNYDKLAIISTYCNNSQYLLQQQLGPTSTRVSTYFGHSQYLMRQQLVHTSARISTLVSTYRDHSQYILRQQLVPTAAIVSTYCGNSQYLLLQLLLQEGTSIYWLKYKCGRTFALYETSVILLMIGHLEFKYRCLIDKICVNFCPMDCSIFQKVLVQ